MTRTFYIGHNLSTVFILLFFVFGRLPADASPSAIPDDWTAFWIGPKTAPVTDDGATAPNTWICFRTSLNMESKGQSTIARLAVDSKYWFWINGRLVVYEGGLKRGPNPQDTYYDEVDLSDHLRAGANTIAVLVWHFGKPGFSHNNSGRAGLVCEVWAHNSDSAGPALLSHSGNGNWKARVHPAYGNTGEPHPNFRLPESNIRFDARLDLGDWTAAQYDDSDWPNAAQYERPPAQPWGHLVKRPIPLFKDFGLKNYANADELQTPDDGGEIIARLPYNAQISPYLKIEAPAGQTIRIQTDNYLGGSAPSVRAEYITRAGVQTYESYGWMNGHDVRYQIPQGVKVLSLKYRETGYATEFTGAFACDDPFLNTLWEKSRRTLYITMRDTYMDCPDRERAQWWGDAVNELGEAFYALCPDSRFLARKGGLELIGWQREDDTIFSPIPAGNWDKELPMQMLASVGWFGFWNYYRHTADLDFIQTVYPGTRDYLAVWELGTDGLVVPRAGGWTWGDWGENKDMRILYNGWYYLALKGQRAMAELVGAKDDLTAIDKKMKSIEVNFNQTFWNGKAYRSPDYTGETDDRANALAVVAGLATKEMHGPILDVLSREHHASPYMEKYVLEAIYLMGQEKLAIQRIHKRFAPMVESELTTLWEGWGIGEEGFGGGTYNHAWSGGPLTMMSQYATGIDPIEPGYKVFQVIPQLGPLNQVDATVDSVAGRIEVSIRRTTETLTLEVLVPQGTEAFIGLPCIFVHTLHPQHPELSQVERNGASLWSLSTSNSADATALQFVNGMPFRLFRLHPGRHVIRGHYETIH